MHRILSLDGFGSWSLIQVRALQDLYGRDTRGRQVLAEFDLVASHGSGSIVAAALAADWPLSKILGLFLDEAARRTVLAPGHPSSASPWASVGRGFGRRYEALVALLHPLSDMLVSDLPETIRNARGLPVHFLFIGWDGAAHEPSFVRSQEASRGWGASAAPRRSLAEAVFAACQVPSGGATALRRSEGALCPIGNPVLAAVCEALANGVPRESIEVLSLGTGNVCVPVSRAAAETGPLFRPATEIRPGIDGRPQPVAVTDDPPDPSTFLAHVSLGLGEGGGRIVRLNPIVEGLVSASGERTVPQFLAPGEASGLSDELIFSGLVQLNGMAVESREVALICMLAEAWILNRVHNQVLAQEGPASPRSGQAWYAEAKAHWRLHADHVRPDPQAVKVIEPASRQVVASRSERIVIV